MSSRRILHVIPTLVEAGAERQLSYLASEMARQNWEVHVVIRKSGPNRRRLDEAGIVVHTIGSHSNYDPLSAWQLLAITKHVNPRIVQTWIVQSDFLGGLAARMLGIPWILSERSSGFAYGTSVKHRMRASLAQHASAIVSNSRNGDAYWERVLTRPVRRYVIPNALPLEEIDETPVLPSDDWQEKGGPLIAYVGRTTLVPKNTHGFVLALRKVIPITGARAIVCGAGPARSEIEALVSTFELGEKVRLVGTDLQVWSLLKKADLLAAVSFYEGNPNAVLEAMACRCPVVVSDIPAHREILDESTAVFVNPSSPTSIADGILRVLADPKAARERSDAAYERTRGLTIARTASMYEQVYQDVLTPRPN